MIKGDKWRSLLVLSSFATPVIHAEEWFQVEVIGFRYTQTSAGSWASESNLPDFAQASRLASPLEAATPESESSEPGAFTVLPPPMLRLAGAYKLLERAGDIVPVFHLGWRQRDTDARTLHLGPPVAEPQDVEAAPPPLEGTVRVTGNAEALKLRAEFVAREGDALVVLRESHTVKPGELHYLDHALAGVLIEVTALTPPADETNHALPAADPVMPD